MSGLNIESMFFNIIDDIVVLQQIKRKKLMNVDDDDLMPPLTTDNLKSERNADKVDLSEQTENMKLKNEQGGKKYCCF